MSDIVERLLQVQGDNEDAREAAAEIGRLRAEIKAQEHRLLFSFQETNNMALAEIKRLRAEIADRDRIMNMSD